MTLIPTINRKLLSVTAASLFAATLLSACGGNQQRDTFDLTVDNTTTSSDVKHNKVQILIEKPDAVKALDGQDIVIKQGGSISYLKQAQWSDRLPDLVQARLLQAFDNSGHFGGVGRPGDGLAINYRIITDIRSFDVTVVGNQKVATMEIAVKILDDRTGNIKASKVFTNRSAVTGVDNGYYAKALDQAFGKTTLDIVNWTNSVI